MTTEADDYLRESTERLLATDSDWPLGPVLPVKRFRRGTFETGVIRREAGAPAEPVVYTEEGPVRSRRYASLSDLLDAGWRAD